MKSYVAKIRSTEGKQIAAVVQSNGIGVMKTRVVDATHLRG
jgi:hypothetical protein